MSRELKFRVWWKDGSEPTIYTEYDLFDDTWTSAEYIAIEQYTGLKDKNGKEIYEGDILSAGDKYYKVVFESIRAGFVAKGITQYTGDHFAGYFGRYLVNHCEVVGNIHENPELLGTKND